MPLIETDGALLGAEVAQTTAADATIATVSAVAVSQGKGEMKEASPNPHRSTLEVSAKESEEMTLKRLLSNTVKFETSS